MAASIVALSAIAPVLAEHRDALSITGSVGWLLHTLQMRERPDNRMAHALAVVMGLHDIDIVLTSMLDTTAVLDAIVTALRPVRGAGTMWMIDPDGKRFAFDEVSDLARPADPYADVVAYFAEHGYMHTLCCSAKVVFIKLVATLENGCLCGVDLRLNATPEGVADAEARRLHPARVYDAFDPSTVPAAVGPAVLRRRWDIKRAYDEYFVSKVRPRDADCRVDEVAAAEVAFDLMRFACFVDMEACADVVTSSFVKPKLGQPPMRTDKKPDAHLNAIFCMNLWARPAPAPRIQRRRGRRGQRKGGSTGAAPVAEAQ